MLQSNRKLHYNHFGLNVWPAGVHLNLICAQFVNFEVNVITVANQWRHSEWSFPLHPSINANHDAGQAASSVLQVFGVTRPGIEPINCTTQLSSINILA